MRAEFSVKALIVVLFVKGVVVREPVCHGQRLECGLDDVLAVGVDEIG